MDPERSPLDKELTMDFNRPVAHVPRPPQDHTLAATFYDRAVQRIQRVSRKLPETEEMVVHYYGQGGEPIQVTHLGYHNPYLINVYGENERGEVCVVLAHMNSVQLVLTVRRTQPEAPKRSIGFVGPSSPGAPDEET
jgi:hypothetical protein